MKGGEKMLSTIKSDAKGFLSTKVGKVSVSVMSVLMLSMMFALPAFAATGTADAEVVSSMEAAFSDVKATGISALTAIGAIAILLFAGVYAWKYGKKVFSIIAR